MRVSGGSYRDAVIRLAATAIQQMPASDFVVKVAAVPEQNLDGGTLASDITVGVQRKGKTAGVRVEVNAAPGRGVVVESADGRLRWDSSFEARLRRLRSSLRRLSIPILFEEG